MELFNSGEIRSINPESIEVHVNGKFTNINSVFETVKIDLLPEYFDAVDISKFSEDPGKRPIQRM